MINYEPLNLNPSDSLKISLKKSEGSQDNASEKTLEERILEKQQQEKEKSKVKKVKFFLLLLLSHSFIFLLASPREITPVENTKNLLPVKIKARTFIHLNKEGPFLIDLYSAKKELILEQVEIKKLKNDTLDSSESTNSKELEILVTSEQSEKISTYLDQEFLVFTSGFKFQKLKQTNKSQQQKSIKHDPYQTKWSQYE